MTSEIVETRIPVRGAVVTRPTFSREVRPIPRWWRDASTGLFWTVLLYVVALWVTDSGLSDLAHLGSGLTSAGRLTGLLASALLLVQVVLMARVPFIEQAWGQDQLTRVHRVVGFSSFSLMVAHIVLITLGYAATGPLGLWGTIVDFTLNYAGMLLAIAGTLALCLVVLTSITAARSRLRYESWHLLHLYAYLGAGLALPHQLWTGQDFLTSRFATVFWWSLYGVAVGAVLVYRVALPLVRSLREPIRVLDVTENRPGVVTVTVGGAGVEHIPAQGGQFFQWRFLDGPGWTRAHPYSLSSAPGRQTLRFTAAVVGDGSARLRDLRPGTRVLLEGPYGRMHPGVRSRRKVLLLAGGIGVTPMKALLESLPQEPGDVTLIQRVTALEDMVLTDEIQAIAAERGARSFVLAGHRRSDRDSWLPTLAEDVGDAEALRRYCPDIADHEVFVCGAPGWMDAAKNAAIEAGVPAEHIHVERFAF